MGAAQRNPQNVKLAKALRVASKELDLPIPTLLQAIKCGDAPITDVICDYWEWYGGNGACKDVSINHLQSSPYRYVLGDCMPRRKNAHASDCKIEGSRSWKKIDYIVGYNDLEKSWFAYSKAWSGWLWGRSEKEIVTKARKGIDKHLAPSLPAWGGRTPLALSRKRKNATSPLKFSFQHSKAGGSVKFRKGKVGKVGRIEVSIIPTNTFHAYLYDEAPNWVLIRDYFNIVRSDGSGKAVPYATKQKVWVAAQQALEKETGLSPTSRARPRKRKNATSKGKLPTFESAKVAVWRGFGEAGWTLSRPNLKVLHATSPGGGRSKVRLWFKPRTILVERGGSPWTMGTAQTLAYDLDLRQVTNIPAFVRAVEKR